MTLQSLSHAPFIATLGWTLLHFLWQGAAIALGLFGVLQGLRGARPAARCLAACAALVLMAGSPVITYAVLMQGRPAAARRAQLVSAEALSSSRGDSLQSPERARPANFLPAVEARFQPRLPSGTLESLRTALHVQPIVAGCSRMVDVALPWLVGAWGLGVLALSLQALGGWATAGALRRGTQPVDAGITERAADLARRMGVRGPIVVRESARIEVPSVVGWLRAVILLPPGALCGLSTTSLEAIIAHEIAHIRRHDCLINLIQVAIETMLFYHPAVWWISNRIRIEREQCCDDLAVEAVGDRLAYARALTRLEELRPPPNRLAMAGAGGDLPARIRRLVGQRHSKEAASPLWLLGMTALITLAPIGAASYRTSNANPPLSEAAPTRPLPGGHTIEFVAPSFLVRPGAGLELRPHAGLEPHPRSGSIVAHRSLRKPVTAREDLRVHREPAPASSPRRSRLPAIASESRHIPRNTERHDREEDKADQMFDRKISALAARIESAPFETKNLTKLVNQVTGFAQAYAEHESERHIAEAMRIMDRELSAAAKHRESDEDDSP